MNLNWVYTVISWILLRWHDGFSFLAGQPLLGTNWDWVLAIIFLVITVRAILFPLVIRQIMAQRAVQVLQPRIRALQEQHKGDHRTLQRETMELYRREGANPLMGCLPMLLQIPVFVSLIWILRRLAPTRTANTDLYTWTHEQFHSASLAQLFGAPLSSRFFDPDFARFAALHTSLMDARIVTGVLVLVMAVTTHLTARQMVRRTGWATDHSQLLLQRLTVYGLPLMLLFSGLLLPVGVVIYWVVNNLFSLGQQQWVLRTHPPPALVEPGPARPAVDGARLAPKPGARPAAPKRPGASQQAKQPAASKQAKQPASSRQAKQRATSRQARPRRSRALR